MNEFTKTIYDILNKLRLIEYSEEHNWTNNDEKL